MNVLIDSLILKTLNSVLDIELTQLAEYISQILLKYYIPTIEMLVK
jgi:chromatin remodeling complex protein RSC6